MSSRQTVVVMPKPCTPHPEAKRRFGRWRKKTRCLCFFNHENLARKWVGVCYRATIFIHLCCPVSLSVGFLVGHRMRAWSSRCLVAGSGDINQSNNRPLSLQTDKTHIYAQPLTHITQFTHLNIYTFLYASEAHL
jgi:hypothetical protein